MKIIITLILIFTISLNSFPQDNKRIALQIYQPTYKIDGVTLRLRSEKVKKEMHYFLDKFENEKFISGDTPFYKGIIAEGYNDMPSFEIENDFILMRNIHKEGNIQYVSKIKYTFFKRNDFSFISSSQIDIPVEYCLSVSSFNFDKIADKNFITYKNYDKTTDKVVFNIIALENFKLHPIKIDSDKTNFINTASFYENANDIFSYVIFSENSVWTTAIYKLNSLTNTFEFQNQMNINSVNLKKDFKKDGDCIEKLSKLNFTTYYNLKEEGSVYLISTSNTITSQYGTLYENLLITKISGNQIMWNQFIKRSSRNDHFLHFSSVLTQENLEITDKERDLFFDEKGKYIQGIDTYVLLPKFLDLKYIINKQTGEFQRKLL